MSALVQGRPAGDIEARRVQQDEPTQDGGPEIDPGMSQAQQIAPGSILSNHEWCHPGPFPQYSPLDHAGCVSEPHEPQRGLESTQNLRDP